MRSVAAFKGEVNPWRYILHSGVKTGNKGSIKAHCCCDDKHVCNSSSLKLLVSMKLTPEVNARPTPGGEIHTTAWRKAESYEQNAALKYFRIATKRLIADSDPSYHIHEFS